jgi:signal transduction histidine kinase
MGIVTILSNSITNSNKEKGLIEIGVQEKEFNFEFFIRDNGVGIAKAYHDKIFKVFTKLESNNKSAGIGLSIVKKIVEFYKGKIWLESEEKKRTTFYFTLLKNHGTS